MLTGKDRTRSWLFLAIAMTTVVLVILHAVLLFRLAPDVLITVPAWLLPVIDTWVILAAACAAFLAFGRYHVLRDPVCYWTGMGLVTFSLLHVFRFLVWPGLLPDGGAILGQFPNTSAALGPSGTTLLAIALLVAVLCRWPAGQALRGWRWLGFLGAWLALATLAGVMMLIFERSLPAMLSNGNEWTTFGLAVCYLDAALFAAGFILSTRWYLMSGDTIPAYAAFIQITLGLFALSMAIGGHRYALFAFIDRLLCAPGFWAMAFGLLSQYVHLYRSEQEKSRQLRQSEERLRRLFDSGMIGIIYWTTDGTIRDANDKFLAIVGYSREDLRRGLVRWDKVTPREYGHVDKHAFRELKTTGIATPYEKEYIRKDGSRVPIIVGGAMFGDSFGEGVAFVLDITDYKMAEQEIRLLKHSIDVYDDGAFWVSSDNRFVYVNDAACKSLGYTHDELIGKSISDIAPSRTGDRVQEVWQTLREEGSIRYETVHRRKDGTEFPVELVVTHIQFGGREFACGFARDISERKRLEAQLRQAQKMEAVGSLAGGIAHDFNNMLAVIIGNAELALDDLKDCKAPTQNIEQILGASNRARDLTRQILTFSRKAEYRRDRISLAPLLKETHKMLRGTLPATINLHLDVRTDMDTVLADPSQIQQVLINLATNATYAMRARGGDLTITLEDVTAKQEGRIAGADLPPGAYVKLGVRDTGTGMTEENRRRIFEPFFTTKEQGQGTGMGLAVVYGIVTSHDGAITVESTPGRGSAFNVFLPLSRERADIQPEEMDDVSGGRERILFVDDENALLQTVRTTLQRLGYTVAIAVGGVEAWDMLKKNPDAYDLVVTDQVMPGLTGTKLAEKVRQIRPRLPFVLVTGYAENVSPEDARRAGISAFATKPITRREFARAIREALSNPGPDLTGTEE